jgi:ATP-dependent RNA helicase DeaD
MTELTDPNADMTASSEAATGDEPQTFQSLGLPDTIVTAVTAAGYTSPTPIQCGTIPALLDGRDVLGQAQTGTGKTAAFALPILARLSDEPGPPQALVLAPTRELAMQVAEAFTKYGKGIKAAKVTTVYGGQPIYNQLRSLKRMPSIVVGTPGRIIDHLDRGSLDLSALRWLVLDEADEMLRMGFFEDVTRIMDETPESRATVLFSATLPNEVKTVARKKMRDPVEVRITPREVTATTVRQRFLAVWQKHKFEALQRILEIEPTDGVLIFVRTKAAATELSNHLSDVGFASAPLSGDLSQPMREATVERLKSGAIDLIVATDVAARGLDVERITHVINYDIPFDTEAYIHRIGRTGRAGREGTAVLFVQPRERRMLASIERATKQHLEEMALPSAEDINAARISRFKDKIRDAAANADLALYRDLLTELQDEDGIPAMDAAAALAHLLQGETPLLVHDPEPSKKKAKKAAREESFSSRDDGPPPAHFDRNEQDGRSDWRPREDGRPPRRAKQGMEWFRVAVGAQQGIQPSNLVGAIANEAGLTSANIGIVAIHDRHSWVELPSGMPRGIFEHLRRVKVRGARLNLERAES